LRQWLGVWVIIARQWNVGQIQGWTIQQAGSPDTLARTAVEQYGIAVSLPDCGETYFPWALQAKVETAGFTITYK
jgi:hypothetical protein